MPALGLTVEIRGDASKLDSALDASKGNVSGFSATIGKGALAVGAVAGAAGLAATAIVGMTQAAAADEAEQAKLMATIQAAGAATAESTAQVEAAIAAGQERAFTDSETRAGLESLVTATGDVQTATALLTTAQDVARFAGVDLATAADAVAKAHAGQDMQLRRLIPGMAKGATSADTIAAATKAAAGQADLYAESAEGMQAKATDAFSEIQETIGSAFLPVLKAVLPALLPILKAFAELVTALLPVLIPLIEVLASVLGAVATVLSRVVGWLSSLVRWLGSAMAKVGDFLDTINPLSHISLPSLPFIGGTAAGATGARSGRAGAAPAAGGITINVHGAIDPEGVARSVARVLSGHSVRMGHASALIRR
jgi:hypothetical protein